MATHFGPAWMVLQAATAGELTTAKANGATHGLVEVAWDQCQTVAAGAVDATATLGNIQRVLDAGLKVCLRVSLQYIPTFVDTAAVKFKNNSAADWNPGNISGGNARDWVWSAATRALVDDFLTKLFTQLDWTQIERVQLGGVVFGEVSYPTTDGTVWWGYSAPAQTGTGLASGQVVCPVPGHVPSTGTTWTANDIAFHAWYRDSLINWMTWLIGKHRAYFSGPVYVMHPGAGLRAVSQTPTSSTQALNFRANAAAGLHWVEQIAAYPDAQVYPYSTWADSAHFWPPDPFSDVNDGNAAPWYHLLRVARAAGRADHIWGENTGGNTNAQMDTVFASGAVAHGFQGLAWLSHASLSSGTDDTYANFAARIATANAAFAGGVYSRGVNMAGAEFAADAAHLPGTYSTDYEYDSSAAITQIATYGHKIIRVPFRWERIQPTRNAALNATELSRLTAVVTAATSAGMKVVLDVHNYARFIVSGGAELVLGTDVPAADLVDLWTRLSVAFKGNPGIYAYGLMNEPHDLVGTTGSFSGVVRYNWNAGTVAGWTGDSATATNVSSKLHLAATATTGYFNFRKDDAATLAGGALTGNTLQAVITLGSGITGNWKAILQWQTPAFAWQSPTSTTYTRVDTGAVVSGLIANVAVTVRATWSGGITSPLAFAIQIEANDATAGAVSVDVDDFAQGSLTGSFTGAQAWESIAQQCVTAIRGNADTTKILVPGYGFSGAKDWTTNHPTAWITGGGDIAYEAHYYFDVDNSGDYPDTYATENSAAVAAGYTNLSSRAAREMGPWLQWLVRNGVRGFVGEMGWTHTADTASWNAVGETLYDELDRYGVDVTYWSAGARWGTSYNLSAYTGATQTTATAQAPIIEAHLSEDGTAPPTTPPAPPSSGVGARHNLAPNPALKTTISGPGTSWTSSPAGYVRQTGLSGMDRTTGFGGTGAVTTVTSPRFVAVAGQQYMASVQIKTGAANSFKMLINWYTGASSGSFVSATTTTSFTVNGTQRVEIGPFTAPTGAGGGYLRIIDLDNTTVSLTAELVEQTNNAGRAYFDGDTVGATWEGTSGNSPSQLLVGTDAWSFTDAGARSVTASGPTAGDATTFADTGSVVASSHADEYITWTESALIVALSYDSRRGRVRVDAHGLPTTAVRAEVSHRPVGRTAWSVVRGGKVAVTAGQFSHNVDDYEFAAGTANTYRIRAFSTQEGVADVVVAQAVVTLAAVLDEVWLKFIAAPVFNRRVQLIDWGEITRPARVATYDVSGRSDPVAVLDVHGSRRVTVQLRTSTKAEAEDLDFALSQGLPLFLHVPETVALPSLYAAAGDVSSPRPSKTTQVRYWSIPLIEVAPPPASIVGAASTWQSLLDGYASWSDVIDGFTNWQEAAS